VAITDSPPAAIPAFPHEFRPVDIGVTMRVKPTVTSDNRTIELSLVPEVTDFEGFINYGTPLNVTDSGGTSHQLIANTINQPVFNRRKVSTNVSVRDGYTVVLGGLVREDYQDVNDKVPILGDIPFIGRAFRSKATKSVKKNLLIFASARIMRPDGEPLNRLDDGAVAVSN
jgi:general secretion pathway protein D